MAPIYYEQSLLAVDELIAAMIAGTTSALPARKAAPQQSSPPAAKPKPPNATESGNAPPAKPAMVKAAKVAKPAAEPAADRAIDVSWLDFRVGHILDAHAHPESDKLYVESIDVGEPEPRTILSGLAHYMPLDKVRGARVIVVCNLPARPLAGIPSHGMVLCASDVDAAGNKTTTEFVVPPADAKVGERVTFDAYPGEPVEATKLKKKKGWETCAPHLATDASGVATYRGAAGAAAWMTSAGPCTAATVKSGPIS
jgi:tRNA-binding EMAP/Myf-like protein